MSRVYEYSDWDDGDAEEDDDADNYPRALCRDLTSSLVFPQPDEVVRIVPTSTAIRWMC